MRDRTVGVVLLLALVAGATTMMSRQALPDGFTEMRPDQVRWMPSPTIAGGQVAVLLGDPQKTGPLVVRAKLPPGSRTRPHTHPEARTYTVLSGEWQLGFGSTFDPAALRSYPAGSMYRLPPRVPHFQATGAAETEVQIESIGPSSTDYLKGVPE